MKVPIPDDWNGVDWTCVQMQWPNSPKWIGILTGFISSPGLGRYWDENTGIITSAQETGREIWERNWPYEPCGDVIPEQPDQDLVHCLISSAVGPPDEELAMSLCGYNPKAFRINDGVFQVRDFCGDWVDIGEMSSDKEEPPPDIWDDVDPDPDFFACGKVEYIIDQFILLSNAAWDNYTNPFAIEGAMRNAVTDAVNLNRVKVYEWMALLLVVAEVAQKSDFNDGIAVQNAKCLALGSIDETGTGTDAEVDAVVAALASAFNNQIGEITEIPWAAYWGFVRDTFGRKDCRLLLSLGSTNPAGNCECGGEWPIGPVTFEDTRVIHLESQGAALTVATQEAPNIMYFEVLGGQNENFQEVQWDERLQATGLIQQIRIEYRLERADVPGYYPSWDWQDDNPTPLNRYDRPEVIAPAPDDISIQPQLGLMVLVMKWDVPTDLDGASLDFGPKINPKDQDPNRQRFVYRATITYSGDLL